MALGSAAGSGAPGFAQWELPHPAIWLPLGLRLRQGLGSRVGPQQVTLQTDPWVGPGEELDPDRVAVGAGLQEALKPPGLLRVGHGTLDPRPRENSASLTWHHT